MMAISVILRFAFQAFYLSYILSMLTLRILVVVTIEVVCIYTSNGASPFTLSEPAYIRVPGFIID